MMMCVYIESKRYKKAADSQIGKEARNYCAIGAKNRAQNEIKGSKIVSRENQKVNQSKTTVCQNCDQSGRRWH